MRVTKVEISNYRSLGEHVSLTLGNLTALVGPNGSGKSNVVDALGFVSEALRYGLATAVTNRNGFVAMRKWDAGRSCDVAIRVDVADGGEDGIYKFTLSSARDEGYRVRHEYGKTKIRKAKDVLENYIYGLLKSKKSKYHKFESVEGKWKGSSRDLRPKVERTGLVLPVIADDYRFRGLADILRRIAIYSIFPNTLRQPQKMDPATPMDEHGGNWCTVLKNMKHGDRGTDLIAALGRITGDIDDVRVRQAGGYLVAEFRHGVTKSPGGKARARWFPAAQESDGTLRLAGIITALLQEPPLTLIGIEEPELTIHPGALPLLYDYLKEASTRSQVVITTHSPELLSLLDADEVRVVERRDGVTTVSPMEESQREAVKERLLTLGDLMRMEGLRPELPREPAGAAGG